jgi:hypothetical protein
VPEASHKQSAPRLLLQSAALCSRAGPHRMAVPLGHLRSTSKFKTRLDQTRLD